MAVFKRRGKWAAKVYVPGEGQQWLGTFPTKRDAVERERAFWAERERLERRDARYGSETCDEFAGRWLAHYCAGLEKSTLKTYETPVRAFVRDFAGVPLADVDRPTARRWSLRQPRNSQNVIRTMFNHAHRDALVPDNPFANLGLKQSRGRRDLVVLSQEELDALANCALRVHGEYGPAFRAMILFAAYTGMRPGEMFALEWRDLAATTINVRQNLSRAGELKRPKNGKARTIAFPPPAQDALRAVRPVLGQPWVFTGKAGRRFTTPTLHHTWQPVRAMATRPTMAFYELRHFCATYLLERGLPPSDVAVQLGHTDNGALVMSTYGHPSEDAARSRILRVFAGGHEKAA